MAPPRGSFGHWLSRRVFRLPVTRDRAERAVDDELRFHVEGRVEEFIAAGMSRDAAVAEVKRRFGDVDRVRRELNVADTHRRRRASLSAMVEAVVQDLRFAARSLLRRRAFAATAVAVLAIGIGATTAMYTVLDGVLVQPLPYRDPGRLVSIYTTFPEWKGKAILSALWDRIRTPYPTYQRLLAGQQVFQDVAGFYVNDGSLSVGSEAVSVMQGAASANLLSVLGVRPLQGRWFLPGEDGPGASRLAVLSYEFWMSRFGGVPILGRTLTLDEQTFTVVGIMPAGFSREGALLQHAAPSARADVWTPVGTDPSALGGGSNTLELIGRLRPGVSLETAEAATTPLLRGDQPASKVGGRLISRREAETGDVQRPLLVLFGAVSILLLITCGNVSALFLSECAVREPELRTRSVLGAGRGRLARLLLAESAVIAVVGALVGSLIGWQGARMMLALAPRDVPHAAMVHFNARVWLFTMGVALVVALVAGLAPALTLTRPGDANRAAGARVAAGRSRLQTVVLGLQSAMSVVLIAGALLLGRSLANAHRVNPGFSAPNTLALYVATPRSTIENPAERRRLYGLTLDALVAVPGVQSVTAASAPPLSGRTNSVSTTTNPSGGVAPVSASAERVVILPNYFEVLRVPVLAGRAFNSADVDGAQRVVIVSEGFARRFWPGESALGKQLRQPNGAITVVGVVGDVRNKSLDRTPEAAYYLPLAQANGRMSFLVRTRDDPLPLARTLERAIWDAAPGVTIAEVNSMDQLIARALAPARYRAALATLFAALALVLTTVGVAGLAARSVASRLPELCIRMALGATHERVLSLVVRSGMAATFAGIVGGLLLAPFTSRRLADYLFQIDTRDVVSYAATSIITALACIGVTILATRRLRHADLASVLRRG
jgi:predicted permease